MKQQPGQHIQCGGTCSLEGGLAPSSFFGPECSMGSDVQKGLISVGMN